MKTYEQLADDLTRGIIYTEGPERAIQEQIVNQRLLAPFPKTETEVRPGDTNGGRARPLFYVDPRGYDKRLTQVFGLGGYSISTPLLTMDLEDLERGKWNKELKKRETVRMTGLLVAVSVEVRIHTPLMTKTASNVGEKGLDASADNKVTSAQAQAFKRACTQLGVGAYLYYLDMGMVPYDKDRGFGFTVPPDNVMEKALRNAGFKGRCEITGQHPIPWQEAARSMHFLGRVVCDAEFKKLMDAEKQAGPSA